jgi:hypothetical protein
LAGKRAELLKPNLSRIAVLAQPDDTTARAYLDDIAAASRVLGIDVRKVGQSGHLSRFKEHTL